MRAGSFFSAHGVIGNTTDFGSVIGGSSPSVLTDFVYHVNILINLKTTLACESRGILIKENMIDVLDILKRLQQAKKAAGVAPTIVDMVEIQQAASKAVLEELRSLYKEGKVQHHETLNGHAFSIKE